VQFHRRPRFFPRRSVAEGSAGQTQSAVLPPGRAQMLIGSTTTEEARFHLPGERVYPCTLDMRCVGLACNVRSCQLQKQPPYWILGNYDK